MKGFIAILLLLCLHFTLFSQEENARATVYLSDGSILYGEVVKFSAEKDITLSINGTLIELGHEQVTKIVMDEKVRHQKPRDPHKIYHKVNLSLLGSIDGLGAGIHYSINYMLLKQLMVGVGSGIDNYYLSNRRNMVPVFAEVRWLFLPESTSPYIDLKGGYGIPLKSEKNGIIGSKGGVLINPTFGIIFSGKNAVDVELSLGFRMQKVYYELFDDNTNYRKQNITHRRIEFGVGIIF